MSKTGMFLKISLYAILSAICITGQVQAAEHWKINNISLVDNPQAITSFKGYFYVSANYLVDKFDGSTLIRSKDLKNWEIVPFPEPYMPVMVFQEHNGYLYGFANWPDTIYRTNDGLTWSRVSQTITIPQGRIRDALSFGSYLYASDESGTLYRTSGEGTEPIWEKSEVFTATNGSRVVCSFGTHKNLLHVAVASETVPGVFNMFTLLEGRFSWTSEDAWQNERVFINDALRPGAVEFEDFLYWPGIFCWRSPETFSGDFPMPLPPPMFYRSWSLEEAPTLPVPFVLGGALHAIGVTGEVAIRDEAQGWIQTSASQGGCSAAVPRYHRVATLDNMTLALPCKLMSLTQGIFSMERREHHPNDLTAGTKQNVVLQWQTMVNLQDRLTKFGVRNSGTAQNGRDIEKVYLVIPKQGNAVSGTAIPLVPLGLVFWGLPPGVTVPVHDKDTFFLAVDVAAGATDSTCEFMISSLDWEWLVNSDYKPDEAIRAQEPQNIRSAAQAALPQPIDGVVVYPVPSKDNVRFLYSLGEVSDVSIKIFNRSGEAIAELTENGKAANIRSVTVWDATSLAPDVYFASIQIRSPSGERKFKQKVVIER